jgi:DNA polymerase III epsilon subunit-like protein
MGWQRKSQKMREIVLDTETTGLDPLKGHRVVEIGCVELENHMPTGKASTFISILNAICRAKRRWCMA